MLLIAASVTASAALAAMSAVNPAFSQNPDARPKKVVLLPPQVFAFELSAGGLPTHMADWGPPHATTCRLQPCSWRRTRPCSNCCPHPRRPAELDQLDAHIGLYERVAQSVFVHGRGEQSALTHKKNAFDYTVGPGPAFLREQTGADAALIVPGSDFISSSERKAAFVVGLLLGVALLLSQSFVNDRGPPIGHVMVALFDAKGRLSAEYEAPAIVYFQRGLADFEAMVARLRFI